MARRQAPTTSHSQTPPNNHYPFLHPASTPSTNCLYCLYCQTRSPYCQTRSPPGGLFGSAGVPTHPAIDTGDGSRAALWNATSSTHSLPRSLHRSCGRARRTPRSWVSCGRAWRRCSTCCARRRRNAWRRSSWAPRSRASPPPTGRCTPPCCRCAQAQEPIETPIAFQGALKPLQLKCPCILSTRNPLDLYKSTAELMYPEAYQLYFLYIPTRCRF